MNTKGEGSISSLFGEVKVLKAICGHFIGFTKIESWAMEQILASQAH